MLHKNYFDNIGTHPSRLLYQLKTGSKYFIGPYFSQLALKKHLQSLNPGKSRMKDLISRAKGKLDDPIIRGWARDRYSDVCKYSPGFRESMEQAWFDDLSLRRWIENDASVLISLFRLLPATRFCGVQELIAKRWEQWDGMLASWSAPVLAQLQPEKAGKLFLNYLQSGVVDSQNIFGIVRSLDQLPVDQRISLFNQIEGLILKPRKNDFDTHFLMESFVKMSFVLKLGNIDTLIEKIIKTVSDEKGLEKALKLICGLLYKSPHLFDHALDVIRKETHQTFQSLSCFFQDNAPLGECDRLLDQSNPLPETMDLLLDQVSQGVVADKIILALKKAKADFPKDQDKTLACFALGSILQCHILENPQLDGVSLDESIRMISVDWKAPCFDKLEKHIQSFERNRIIVSVQQRAIEVCNTYGAEFLAKLAGRLGFEEFIPLLISWTSSESVDFVCIESEKALVKIGKPAQKMLIEQWDELDFSQKIFGSYIIPNVGGVPAVNFALELFEDLIKDDLERWCGLAETTLDIRILKVLEPELRRKQRFIDRTFYILSILMDFDYPKIEELKSRVIKEEKRQQSILSDFEENYHDKTLILPLRCELCSDISRYNLESLIISEDQEYSHVIEGEFPCVSCGEWPEFEFTSESVLALCGSLLKNLVNKDQPDTSNPLKIISAEWYGEQKPFPEVVALCRNELKQNPDNVSKLIIMGNIHEWLKKPKRSAKYFKRVLELEPNAVEGGLGLARVLSEEGNNEESFRVLDDMLKHKEEWRFFSSRDTSPAEVCKDFSELYNKISKTPEIGNIPALHPSFRGLKEKTGRNDPCPCGSGKKFKKCCLN